MEGGGGRGVGRCGEVWERCGKGVERGVEGGMEGGVEGGVEGEGKGEGEGRVWGRCGGGVGEVWEMCGGGVGEVCIHVGEEQPMNAPYVYKDAAIFGQPLQCLAS